MVRVAVTGPGTALLGGMFPLGGDWRVTVKATATFNDGDGGNTWTGDASTPVVIHIAPVGFSLFADKTAICAGGKPSDIHRTLVTATNTDGSGAAQSGVSIVFAAEDGTLSSSFGITDSNGRATTTLTSSSTASNPDLPPSDGTYQPKVTGTAPGPDMATLTANVAVEFQPADCALYSTTLNLQDGQTGSVRCNVLWGEAKVPGHTIGWRISQIWDADGVLVYAYSDQAPTPPPGYASLQSQGSMTDSEGNCMVAVVAGTIESSVEVEARDQDVGKKPAAANPKALLVLNMQKPDVSIAADDNQCGVTGDFVPSNKGMGGLSHYVTPKLKDGFVIIKAVVPEGVDFATKFTWSPNVRPVDGRPANIGKIDRSQAIKRRVSVFHQKPGGGGDKEAAVLNLWVVLASVATTRLEDIKMVPSGVTPKAGDPGNGWIVPSTWVHQTKLEPKEIWDTAGDIPDLTGVKTQPVPNGNKKHVVFGIEFNKGADRRWDMSRQMRIRILSPTVGSNDFAKIVGTIYDNLPAENRVAEDYPTDDAEGNDDIGVETADNNPYSDKEVAYKALGDIRNPKGWLSSWDKPNPPKFLQRAGDRGDTIEVRVQFREFARLQIGDSKVPGYKNWYRISEYSLWKHHAKLKKDQNFKWVDNGSEASKDNLGW